MLCTGVLQGGTLTPLLFPVYVDPPISLQSRDLLTQFPLCTTDIVVSVLHGVYMAHDTPLFD